ncbi:MAG: DUF3471 domain-containing protein [Planctomycetes bacterium]|nr:DUF3471 domain-containing protein [Planctomycetota bacterium]
MAKQRAVFFLGAAALWACADRAVWAQPPKKQRSETALNLDFEAPADAPGIPEGWGGLSEGYELASDTKVAKTGRRSGRIRYIGGAKTNSPGFGSLTQCIDVGKYRGQRVRYRGYLQTEKVVTGRATLWMRIEGADGGVIAFDNRRDRRVHGTTEWKRYEVVLDVPAEAATMCFGMLLKGDGSAWVDDLKIEIVGGDVPITGTPLRVAIKIDPKLLDDYVGKYRVAGTVFEFRKENDALLVYRAGSPKTRIFPESETKFFYRVLDAQFSFVRDENGKVKRIILHQYGRQTLGNRVE